MVSHDQSLFEIQVLYCYLVYLVNVPCNICSCLESMFLLKLLISIDYFSEFNLPFLLQCRISSVGATVATMSYAL